MPLQDPDLLEILRVTTSDVHIPFSPPLEAPLYPDAAKVVAAVRELFLRAGPLTSEDPRWRS